MNLGMPVLMELETPKSNAQLCARLGLQTLELSMNLPQCCPEALSAEGLRALAGEHGVALTLHLPEEMDLATFHEFVRRGHMQRAVEAVRWAAAGGIKLINMHLHAGVYYTLPEGRSYVYAAQAQGFAKRLLHGVRELSGICADHGIALCVENTGQFNLDFLAGPLQALLDEGAVGLTWDTGHDGKAGFADRPFLLRNAAALRHMHLHDFDDSHDHWPLNTGRLNLAEMLHLAQAHDLSVILEVKTARALERSVEVVRERLSKIDAI